MTEAPAGEAQPAATALGYEQARDELMEVVRRLEAGPATLEESLRLWERGEHLATVCQTWLQGARATIETAIAQRSDEANPSSST